MSDTTNIHAVSSFIELRKIRPTSRTRAIVAFRATPGDGGGGTFFCDHDDRTTPDDYALTVVTNSGLRMKRVYSGPLDVRWFGARGDGVTDDTEAIRSALEAARRSKAIGSYPGGGTVLIPAGVFRITDTLLIHDLSGGHVCGAGNRTVILWDGANGVVPAFHFRSCMHSTLRDLSIVIAPGRRLYAGVQFTTGVNYGYPSSRNRVENVWINAHLLSENTELINGLVVGDGGLDINNDFIVFDNCTVWGFQRYGLLVNNSQCFNISARNCHVVGSWRTTNCDANHLTNTFSNIPASLTGLIKEYDWLEVDGIAAGGGTCRFKVGSVTIEPNGTLTVVASEYRIWPTSSATGASLRYGGQAAICPLSGSINWEGGAGGRSLNADIFSGITGGTPSTVSNAVFESSRAFIRMHGPSDAIKGLVVNNCRFSGEDVLPGDQYAVQIVSPGTVEIANTCIGDFGNPNLNCKVAWSWGSDTTRGRLVMRNVAICNNDATGDPSVVFPGYPPTSVVDCMVTSGAAPVRFGDLPVTLPAGSGERTVEMSWPEHKVTINGATTFLFNGMPRYRRTRLHLVHMGGVQSVTWPAITWLGGEPVLTADDWFEFWSDGAVVWGRRL